MNLQKLFIGLCFQDDSILYKTKLSANDFSGMEKILFQAMKDVLNEGEQPNEININEKTNISYSQLMEYNNADYMVMAPNWSYYEKQIREVNNRKKIRLEMERMLNENLPSDEMIANLQDIVNDVQEDSMDFEIRDIESVVNETYDLIMHRYKANGGLIGITSGLRRLDEMTFGFQDRRLYYIGGRPSQGKTALLLNFALNCPETCGFISAESANTELSIRMIARGGLIDSDRLSIGMIETEEFDNFNKSVDELRGKHLYIYDKANADISEVTNIARQMKKRFNIKILFIDYLQILGCEKVGLDYYQKVAYNSKQLKAIARNLNIPVVASAQLRRDAEGNRPQLSDFSDSTQIERDADVAIMIYNKYDKESQELKETYLLIEKNRDGKTGDIPVTFNREYVNFRDNLS